MTISPDRLQQGYEAVRDRLLAERIDQGHWIGRLATSALSTATAISALSLVERGGASIRDSAGAEITSPERQALIQRGTEWLTCHQNDDGGWGDTDRSYSNIATTMLCRAALHLAGMADVRRESLRRAEAYIDRVGGLEGLRRRYGRDKTFAVPILANCALAGLVPWSEVSPLPFELACLPQSWYRFAQLPVVSYAIPALVAIGQARFLQQPPRLPPVAWLRRVAVAPSLHVLRKMQPASGGYLEAIPLTSFVVMSLAGSGRAEHEVVQAGVQFIRDSVREDGSWPIDTNLATWNTSLAIRALAEAGEDVGELTCWNWLLDCQHRSVHPFTGAEPGGWGWSDLSGAVPDADDTPGALLALAAWRNSTSFHARELPRLHRAVGMGLRWLLKLQNRDGGWPTFCRGWGKLPFDRSGSDLTAHVLRALRAWQSEIEHGVLRSSGISPGSGRLAIERGFRYLERQQAADGSWKPLWFGNQDRPDEENPVYGTAKVLLAYFDDRARSAAPQAAKGVAWLLDAQNPDGGWGGGWRGGKPVGSSSWEETSLAVESLGAALEQGLPPLRSQSRGGLTAAWERGTEWLLEKVESGQMDQAAPIGFYFAKLWYYEALYPITFAAGGLGRAVRVARHLAVSAERTPAETT